jgi:hypothetical protein
MPDVGRFDGFAGVRRGFLTEIQLTKVPAGRKAFLWEHETYDLLAPGKPLTGLEGIGPLPGPADPKMEFALAVVLAGFEPHQNQIVNFLPVDELRKWISQISQPH